MNVCSRKNSAVSVGLLRPPLCCVGAFRAVYAIVGHSFSSGN